MSDKPELSTKLASKNKRFVRIGMAGYIDRSPDANGNEIDAAISGSFLSSPGIHLAHWRGRDCYAVTADLASDRMDGTDRGARELPSMDDRYGLILGHTFDGGDCRRNSSAGIDQLLAGENDPGPELYSGVNGAWVGFTWNPRAARARFFRDEVGASTLYVVEIGEILCFSTDIRILVRCMTVAGLDIQAVCEFLHYLYHPAPRTMVKGIHAVLPGHVLTFEKVRYQQDKVSRGRFHVPNMISPTSDIDTEIERQLPKFEELLLSAVDDCLPRQGSVGLSLSGGKDSSVLAVALQKICPDRVIAMTVGQRGGEYDETEDAASVCRHLGLTHRVFTPNDDELIDGLDDFFRAQDQPIGDPAALPYFLAMRTLREDCEVLLDGTGNDYYFGISSEHRGKWLFKKRLQLQRRMPDFVWRLLLTLMSRASGNVRGLAKAWSEPIEETFVAWNGWSSADIREIFHSSFSLSETYMWQLFKQINLNNAMSIETNAICGVWEPHSPYRKAVNFANSLGMQVRFPFIDRRLLEFVQSLPIELRNYGGVTKVLIRRYMEKHLPASIIHKPKSGFIFDLARVLASRRIDLSGDVKKTASILDLNDDAIQFIRQIINEYQSSTGRSENEHRVYSAWLFANVVDANYDITENRRPQ